VSDDQSPLRSRSRRLPALQGTLLAATPMVWAATLEWALEHSGHELVWSVVEVVLGFIATLLGSSLLTTRSRASRLLFSAGVLLLATVTWRAWTASPSWALIAAVIAISCLGAVWSTPDLDISERRALWVMTSRWRAAGLSSTVGCLVVVAALDVGRSLVVAAGAIVAVMLTVGLYLASLRRLRGQPAGQRRSADQFRRRGERWLSFELLYGSPARILVLTFFVLCAAGALGLSLPICSSTGVAFDMIDAAFTSVSAVCVTGLIVVDTARDVSAFGQAVILTLIQLGGLGIMTLSTAALLMLGRRMSMRYEGVAAELLSVEDRSTLSWALRRILLLTVIAELMGAAGLTFAFLETDQTFSTALWRGVFTSISAFCNAGFAIQSDSLIAYRRDPVVLHIVSTLIVIGGLSPAVVTAIPAVVRRRNVPLQVKLALTTTGALLVGGAFLYAALEWSGSLEQLGFAHRFSNAYFQSVTARTAGFNSVDLMAMRPATLTVMIALMFIGGSPGGTAGGVKTTTFVVLLLAVGGALRGRWEANAFGRRITHDTVYRAAAIFLVGILTAVTALIAIQVTQTLRTEEAIFEVISALGTVGLSIGGTSQLDEVGKAIIMVCMFAGRVGPLTLFLFLSERKVDPPWKYPDETVEVG